MRGVRVDGQLAVTAGMCSPDPVAALMHMGQSLTRMGEAQLDREDH